MGAGHGIGIKRNDYHRRNRRRNISMFSKSAGTKEPSSYMRLVNTPITVPTFERDVLIQLTEKHNQRHKYGNPNFAIKPSRVADKCVTYLRHEHNPYESLLKSRRWKNTNRDVYLLLFKRVMDAIAEANPWLADECKLQYEEKSGSAFSIERHVRVVKGGGLTSLHVQEHNEKEEGVPLEIAGYVGEDDGTFRIPLTSLASDRLLYQPPFLKREEIIARRFTEQYGEMNDRWWEWEEEKGLRIPEREQRFRWNK